MKNDLKKKEFKSVTIGNETQYFFDEWMTPIFDQWVKEGEPEVASKDPFKKFAKRLKELFVGQPIRFPFYNLSEEYSATKDEMSEDMIYCHYGILKNVTTIIDHDDQMMIIKFTMEGGNFGRAEKEFDESSSFVIGNFPAQDIKKYWGKFKKDSLIS